MLACGADGTTLSELQKAIGAMNVNMDSVNELNRRMMIGQRKPTGGEYHGPSMMTTTNFFEDRGIDINNRYKSTLEKSYFATVIHSWAIDHTATLSNKITLSAKWMCYFSNLKNALFRSASGDSVKVTMMENEDCNQKLSGMSDNLCSAIRLPYEGQYSMLVILPSRGYTISTLLRTLTPEYLSRIQNSLHHYDIIHIHLPAFSTKVKLDLKKSLTNIGYGNMFVRGKANFSRMTDAA